MNKLKFIILLFVVIMPISISFTQSSLPSGDVESPEDEESSTIVPISSASYLGVTLGMSRSEIVDKDGNPLLESGLDAVNNLHLLEINVNKKEVDRSIISGKAVPFIQRIYYQFIKDPFGEPLEIEPDGEEIHEYKLYEILIHFNEDHIGYYELQDILTNGMEIINPNYKTDSGLPKTIIMKGYGKPSYVEPQKIVWGDDKDSKVKIILTRSNKINRFGNVVRLIHKEAFSYIVDLNDPRGKTEEELVKFADITALGDTSLSSVIATENISEVGRRIYFLASLLPQVQVDTESEPETDLKTDLETDLD